MTDLKDDVELLRDLKCLNNNIEAVQEAKARLEGFLFGNKSAHFKIERSAVKQMAEMFNNIGEYMKTMRPYLQDTRPQSPPVQDKEGVEHIRFNDGPNGSYADKVSDNELNLRKAIRNLSQSRKQGFQGNISDIDEVLKAARLYASGHAPDLEGLKREVINKFSLPAEDEETEFHDGMKYGSSKTIDHLASRRLIGRVPDGIRPYPELLTDQEQKELLKFAEDLWHDLQGNQIGGFSGHNRPFYIKAAFKDMIEKYGHRDVGLHWSPNDLKNHPAAPDDGGL